MPSSPQEVSSPSGYYTDNFVDSPDSDYMPNQYIIYDDKNIGYSYDSNTGTYIPVSVTVGDPNPNFPDVNMQMYYGYPTMSTSNTGSFENDGNKRPRKRKRKSPVKLPAPNELINAKDYEDSLISLDSQTFDEYVERAYQYRKYSEEEKEYFRDVRRRIKNRESARKSRMNKRTKLDNLSGQVKGLNDQTALLKQENESLKLENYQLKNEVIYLRNFINTQNYGKQGNTSVKEETKSSSPMGSHSILLFVILFSFGILWNLDVSIFNSPLLQNSKPQFLTQTPPKTIDDPMLEKLLDNMHDEGQTELETQRFHDYKKDVEICC